MTINDVISEAGTLHFHFMGEYSKLDRVKTMGTRGKINAIHCEAKKHATLVFGITLANIDRF